MHGTKHEWQCAEQVLSLAALVGRSPGLQWELLLERATALGGRRVLLLGLNLAHTWFECPLPGRMVAEIDRDAMVAELTAQVWDYFLGIRQPATSAMQTASFQARSRERRADRLRYWILKIFAPNWDEVEWLPLPRRLMPLLAASSRAPRDSIRAGVAGLEAAPRRFTPTSSLEAPIQPPVRRPCTPPLSATHPDIARGASCSIGFSRTCTLW